MNRPTEVEWKGLCDRVLAAMSEHVKPYLTPISQELDADRGQLVGTGNYLEFDGRIFLLTNEHVAVEDARGPLGHRFHGSDIVYRLDRAWTTVKHPVDLALIRMSDKVWQNAWHEARGIPISAFAKSHTPVSGDLLFIVGYSGERQQFYFGHLNTPGTPYLSQEAELPTDDNLCTDCHFAIHYLPDRATSADPRSPGLPLPNGFSGALVWNTRFLECCQEGSVWSASKSVVTGMIIRWAPQQGLLVATKVELLPIADMARSQK